MTALPPEFSWTQFASPSLSPEQSHTMPSIQPTTLVVRPLQLCWVVLAPKRGLLEPDWSDALALDVHCAQTGTGDAAITPAAAQPTKADLSRPHLELHRRPRLRSPGGSSTIANRLLQNVQALTTQHEADFPAPWNVTDAPAAYVDGQLKGIIGIRLRLDRLEGKWKVSQNRPAADRQGVAAGLRDLGAEASEAMANLVDATLQTQPRPERP
jgi:hypothetical protein